MTHDSLTVDDSPAGESTPKLSTDMVYGLNDRPPVIEACFVALQHVMAVFVGIITPPLIICNALGLEPADTAFIISMSLFISGLATFIQAKRIGPIGSGLLSIQGTSFTFIGPILSAGFAVIEGGGSGPDAMAMIFGLCFFGAFIEIILSRFLHLASRVITPLVTGVVVTLIGLTLIKVGMISMAGGFGAQQDGTFGSLQNLGLAGLVLLTIVLLNTSRNQYLRMASIVIGLVVGYVVSIILGRVDFSLLSQLPPVSIPMPFRYGLNFSFTAFIPFMLIYLITTIETIGDLTATSAITGEPISGGTYMRRIKGGVLGDGVNSLIAACFSTFPNTTFSQNNGVIQLTGVGSRYVGFFIAGILAILGFVPVIAGIFQVLPQPVLGGATIIMFGSVAVAGIKILSSVEIDRRALTIVAISLGLGLGVTFVPEVLDAMPKIIKDIFASGITTGGLSAILLNLLLPSTVAAPQRKAVAKVEA